MPEIIIISMYNGRRHKATIRRAERVCQVAVDGVIVYDDEELEEGLLSSLKQPQRVSGEENKS